MQRIGRYELLTRLSEGGFGEVYAASLRTTADFSTLVAIKVLHSNLLADGQVVRLFDEEARLGGRLIHPNITRVIGFEEEGEIRYLVMELVDGVSFSQLVAHRRQVEAFAEATLLEMIAQACDGLHYAHGIRDDNGKLFGLVHRDIKPSNLMLDRSGLVKVMDFGIAKAEAEGRDPTLTGMLKGTPAYMAPEMARGERGVELRADIYAMGAVFFELQTGQRLYQGSQLALIHQAGRGDVSTQLAYLREHASPEVYDIIAQALSPEPVDRFTHAAQMARACRTAIIKMGVVPEVRELAASLAPPPIRPGRAWGPKGDTQEAPRMTILPWSARLPGAAQKGDKKVQLQDPPAASNVAAMAPAQGKVNLEGVQPSRKKALLGLMTAGVVIFLTFLLGNFMGGSAQQPEKDTQAVASSDVPASDVPSTHTPTSTATPTKQTTPTPVPVKTASPPKRRAPKVSTRATPIPEKSLLIVNTAPEEQPIWIDGRRQNSLTPWRQSLPIGSHRIEVGENRKGSKTIRLTQGKSEMWLAIKSKTGWDFQQY